MDKVIVPVDTSHIEVEELLIRGGHAAPQALGVLRVKVPRRVHKRSQDLDGLVYLVVQFYHPRLPATQSEEQIDGVPGQEVIEVGHQPEEPGRGGAVQERHPHHPCERVVGTQVRGLVPKSAPRDEILLAGSEIVDGRFRAKARTLQGRMPGASQYHVHTVVHWHNPSLGLNVEPRDPEDSKGCSVQHSNGSVQIVNPTGHGFLIAGNN